MELLFANYITTNKEAFLKKVVDVAGRLGVHANWLMAVMFKESRLNHKAVNANGGATGLIQFMPNTAQGLGTSPVALAAMSNVEQLDYVYKYYRPYKGKINSYVDLYLATFFPVAIGKPGEWVFQSSSLSAQTIARSNPGITRNENGVITVASFTAYCYKGFSENIINILKKK